MTSRLVVETGHLGDREIQVINLPYANNNSPAFYDFHLRHSEKAIATRIIANRVAFGPVVANVRDTQKFILRVLNPQERKSAICLGFNPNFRTESNFLADIAKDTPLFP